MSKSESYLIRGHRVMHRQFYNRKADDYSGKVHLYIYEPDVKAYWMACHPEQRDTLHLIGSDYKGVERPQSVEVTCYGCNRMLHRLKRRGTAVPIKRNRGPRA
jgi:hypothetical protein